MPKVWKGESEAAGLLPGAVGPQSSQPCDMLSEGDEEVRKNKADELSGSSVLPCAVSLVTWLGS